MLHNFVISVPWFSIRISLDSVKGASLRIGRIGEGGVSCGTPIVGMTKMKRNGASSVVKKFWNTQAS